MIRTAWRHATADPWPLLYCSRQLPSAGLLAHSSRSSLTRNEGQLAAEPLAAPSKALLTTSAGRARGDGAIAHPFALYGTMRRTGHLIFFAACGAAVLAAPIRTADAQEVQVGTLACRGGPDTGFIVGPITNLELRIARR